jgi:hypothetical protein
MRAVIVAALLSAMTLVPSLRAGQDRATQGGTGNDSCFNPIPINDGDHPFSNLGAILDGPQVCPSMNTDVWFQYVASCDGDLQVSTCNQADFDTVITVYDQYQCPPLGDLGCNDDEPGCAGFTSQILVPVVAGGTYQIQVGGWNGAEGTGILSVNCDSQDGWCGNGIIDPGEQCDDGNTADCDGCSATCQDGSDLGGEDCVCSDRILDVQFGQMDWLDDHGDPVLMQSRWGQVTIMTQPCPQSGYLNVVVSSALSGNQWGVRNFYLAASAPYSGAFQPDNGPVTTTFDLGLLGVQDGTDLASLSYQYMVTPDPLFVQPLPSQPPVLVPVNSITVRTGGAAESHDEVFTGPGDPSLPVEIVDPGIEFEEIDIDRPNVPNVETAKNQCAPASIANCMKWMSDYWNLGLEGTLEEILEDVDDATGREECKGLKHKEIIEGKLKFIKAKGLPVRVHYMSKWVSGDTTAHGRTATRDGGIPTWDYIKQELEKGQDIELVYQRDNGGAHAVVVTGVYQKKDGTKGIRFKDDIEQDDDDAGTDDRESDIGDNDGSMNILSRPKNKVTGVFSESPTKEAMLARISKLIGEISDLLQSIFMQDTFMTAEQHDQMSALTDALKRTTENLHHAVTGEQPGNADAAEQTENLRTIARDMALTAEQLVPEGIQNPTMLLTIDDLLNQAFNTADTVFLTLTRGSCCLYDGTCADGVVADDCQVNGGIYNGDNTACQDLLCFARGACCNADGSCSETTQVACDANGGSYAGDGTMCLGDPLRTGNDLACEVVDDICADRVVDVNFGQMDWVDDHELPLATNSMWGQVRILHTPCPNTGYINIVANDGNGGPDQWIVRNFIAFGDPGSEPFLPPSGWETTTFDLGLLGGQDGVNFPQLNYYVTVHSDPIFQLPPQQGPLFTADVNDVTVLTGGAEETPNDIFTGPGDPTLPAPTTDPGITFPEICVERENVPNVETAKNQCAPAAIANCMKWMSDYWNLGLEGTLEEILEDVDEATGREECEGLYHREIIAGKLKFIKTKGLPVRVHFMSSFVGGDVKAHDRTATRDGGIPTWDYIKQELEKGQDIELVYQRDNGGAHAVVVTGVYQKKDGTRGIKFKDDLKQGNDNAGTDCRKSDIGDNGGYIDILNRPKNKVTGVFSESPTKEAMAARIAKLINELIQLLSTIGITGVVTPEQAQQLEEINESLARTTGNLHHAVSGEQPGNAPAQQTTDGLQNRADGMHEVAIEIVQLALVGDSPTPEMLSGLQTDIDECLLDIETLYNQLDRGACCLSSGGCAEDVVPDACQVMGGVYQGTGAACDPTACTPRGACCLSEGTCDQITETECTDQGGTYNGDTTECLGASEQDLPDEACPGVGGSCSSAASCCDSDGDNVRDNVCTWCDCVDTSCETVDKVVPADLGGAFGQCQTDTFCNIHDRTAALSCFAGTSSCDAINVDAGGAFGACQLDGFCNIHDANHTMTCFAGINPCVCGPAPHGPGSQVVGEAHLRVNAMDRVRAGQQTDVQVYVDTTGPDLQSYQVHVESSGGRRGHLELVDIGIDDRKDAALPQSVDHFSAINVERGQMLAGLADGGVRTASDRYLATFTFEASADAAGEFVIDVVTDHTFVISAGVDEIAIASHTPAIVKVESVRKRKGTSRR